MQISSADPAESARVGAGGTLLTFVGEEGTLGRWLLLEQGAVAVRGEAGERLAVQPTLRNALAVPGSQVTLHWLELAETLAPAQAAGVARLMLADASAEPLGDMHVAVGRPEKGLTPVALVPASRMAAWLVAAQTEGIDPELIIPEPLLLTPPATGLVRRDAGVVPDYRGLAAAFSVEPELAVVLAGDLAIEPVDEAGFEAGLAPALARPVMNLRQGPFARRREWRVDGRRFRRAIMLAGVLLIATLVLQVATILRYAFAADRLEQEAAALGGASAPAARRGFGATAAPLFDAVRATPNAELRRIDYRADGSLAATVEVDSPATLAALRARIEAGGLRAQGGELRNVGGRPAAEFLLRPA